MQNSGSLAETPLASILETVQKDRATGTLHLATQSGDATLYFLFGHLFHAVDADQSGEPVVYRALDWASGDFSFDAKAKLPAEESIKISTAELLAARESGNGAVIDDPPEAAVVGLDEDEPEAEPAEAEAEIETAPEAAVDAAPPAEELEAAALPPEVPAPKRRRTDERPGTRAPETMEMYPVPLGKLIYEALTASFVDFPKLLRSLAKDRHSGYVRLAGDGFTAVLLFSDGSVVEALYERGGAITTGQAAFQRFGEHIDEGEGVLDVIQLTLEMVTAIFQLLTGPSYYERLLARFVKADALIEYLTEEGMSGAMIVRDADHCGIVLFRDGTVLGAYTDTSRDVDADPAKVLQLCESQAALIEVRGGPVPDQLPVLGTGVPAASVSAAPAPAVAKAAPEPAPAPAAPAPEPAAAPPPTPTPAPAPRSAAPKKPPRPEPETAAAPTVDWASVINEMAGRADAVLGTRAKKVKELLYATNHSRTDVDGTIEKISELSIMFVDPSKLTSLAEDMRQMAAAAEA